MTIITKNTIVNRPFGKKQRKIKQRFVDQLGNVFIKKYIVDAGTNLQLFLNINAVNVDFDLKSSEQDLYLSQISEGVNPFRDNKNNLTTPNFNTNDEIIVLFINQFLSEQEHQVLRDISPKLKIVRRIINNLTDAKIRKILSVDQFKVLEIRSRIDDIDGIAVAINDFVAPIEDT